MLLVLLCLAPPFAQAQQRREGAQQAYLDGKAAYEAKDFETALKHFQRSYTLGEDPALLYNIAVTLQNLNRPGDVAEALREYLKVRPADPERAAIESRIANLARAQEILARDTKLEDERRRRAAVRGPGPGWLSEGEAERRVVFVKEREQRTRRRTLGIALGTTFGVIAVGTAITLGVLLSADDPPKDYDFARVTVTR